LKFRDSPEPGQIIAALMAEAMSLNPPEQFARPLMFE
jgi:hypothetical protein